MSSLVQHDRLSHVLVFHYLPVRLDASPPVGVAGVSCHQPLHHLPLLLLLDQILGNTPPTILPSGQVLTHTYTHTSTCELCQFKIKRSERTWHVRLEAVALENWFKLFNWGRRGSYWSFCFRLKSLHITDELLIQWRHDSQTTRIGHKACGKRKKKLQRLKEKKHVR